MVYIVLVLFFIGRNILFQSLVLPLISYLLFFLQSLYYVLCRAKDQTPGTRAHQSLTPLVRELPLGNITHLSLACHYKPFCRQQGVAELDLHGYIRKFIPVQIIGQSSHNGLLPTGLSAVLLTVPVFI